MKNICRSYRDGNKFDLEYFSVYLTVRQVLAFTRAHRVAQKIFKEEFSDSTLTSTELKVVSESNEQIRLAELALSELDQDDVDSITSHHACHILLNNSRDFVQRLAKQELIPESEASDLLEDLDEYVGSLLECRKLECRKDRRGSSINFGTQEGASNLDDPLLGS